MQELESLWDLVSTWGLVSTWCLTSNVHHESSVHLGSDVFLGPLCPLGPYVHLEGMCPHALTLVLGRVGRELLYPCPLSSGNCPSCPHGGKASSWLRQVWVSNWGLIFTCGLLSTWGLMSTVGAGYSPGALCPLGVRVFSWGLMLPTIGVAQKTHRLERKKERKRGTYVCSIRKVKIATRKEHKESMRRMV